MLAQGPLLSRAAAHPAEPPPRRVVVAGEFNSGKSALLNRLFNRTLLPTGVAQSAIELASILPGTADRWLTETGRNLAESTKIVAVTGALTRLDVELRDSPFPGTVFHEMSLARDTAPSRLQSAALEAADLLIWCTMAQRAWTLTEIGILDILPEALRGGAIVVATRADLLPNDAARARVLARLEREAGPNVAAVLLSQPVCAAADASASGDDSLATAIRTRLSALPRRTEKKAPSALAPLSQRLSPPGCLCHDWHVALSRALPPCADAAEAETRLHDLAERMRERLILAREEGPDPADRQLATAYLAALDWLTPANGAAVAPEDLLDLAIQLEEDLDSQHRLRGCSPDTGTRPVSRGKHPKPNGGKDN